MFVRRELPIFALSLLSTFAIAQQTAQQSAAPTAEGPHPAIAASYGKLPLSFEANAGQSDPQVRFMSRGSGYSLFLTDSAAVLSLQRPDATSHARLADNKSSKADVVRMELAGASHDLHVSGDSQLPGTASYFIGNDPAKWHSNVPTYAKVKYADVYPGVDLVYYGNQRQLEYDFVVAPGADPKPIQLHFAGASKLKVDGNGDLEVIAKNGQIAFHKPVLYQTVDGQRRPVEGSFRLLAGNTVTFKLGTYNHSRRLVIDPTLVYSTYLGGSGYLNSNGSCCGDSGNSLAVDALGNAYIAGTTGSTDFPLAGKSFQKANNETRAHYTVFVSKLNPTATALVYSTYLGGSPDTNYAASGDYGQGIAVDASGSAYVTGYTYDSNFPINHAFQGINNGAEGKHPEDYTANAFVTKLSPDGSSLIYSTYLGGSGGVRGGGDSAASIALDAANEAVVAGTAYSENFPVSSNVYQGKNLANSVSGGSNVFVTKLNASGTGLIFSTYLGGTGRNVPGGAPQAVGDYGTAVAVDGTGDSYVTGYTFSTDFPLKGAFQTANKAAEGSNANGYSAADAFVSKLNSTGTILLYSTYLGGSANQYKHDAGAGIAVDPECNAYVAGQAASVDFPTTMGSLQYTKPKTNALYGLSGFVAKLSASGGAFTYSTYLGGTKATNVGDFASAIGVDTAGNAYVTGTTQSTDFPTTADALQPKNAETTYGSGSAFVSELNPAGSSLEYSSFLGGTGYKGNGDNGLAIAVDNSGDAYVAGNTFSHDLIVSPNAVQPANHEYVAGNLGSSSAFVSKFSIGSATALSSTATSVTADANPAAAEVKTTFTAAVQQSTPCGFPATGTAGFAIDGGKPTEIALNGTGHAAFSTTSLAVGKHTVVVSYSGDGKYQPSSGSLTETIVGPPTSIAAVSGNGQSGVYGSAYAAPLTVIVKDAQGGAAPGVLVTFAGTGLKFNPSTVLTNESGGASVSVTPTLVGSTLTATATATDVSTPVSFTLSAKPAVLTVTANSISVPYDKPIPQLTYKIAGYVNGDTSKAVSGTPTETTTAKQGSAVGTYPITLGLGTLAATNYTFTLVNGTLTINSLGTTGTPVFSPVGGTYASAQSVKITDATAGAAIYYTTNGTTPTTASTKYTAAIVVSATETIKAIAVSPGYVASSVASATYTIQAATPVFSPVGGTYASAQSVKITDATAGAVIYYTTNGTTPTTASTKYTAAITVSATETIKAIAVASGYAASPIASAAYTIQ